MKKFGLIIFSSLLRIALLFLALTGAGWMTFGSPDNIKKAAEENNIYQGAVDNIIDTTKQEAASKAGDNLPLNDPALEKVVRDSFPTELLSTNSESIIDGVYAWLQGKTQAPEFSVDLSGAKQNLSIGVAGYAKQRYEGLPPCSLQDLRAIDPNNVDAFEVNCRVPGLTSGAVYQSVLTEFQGQDTFLSDTTFSANDLPKDEQGRTVVDNLSSAPDAYNLFRSLPWILGVLTVVLGASVVCLSEPKRRGFKSLSITLLGTGIFLLIGSWLVNWSFKQMNGQQQMNAFQKNLIDMLGSLVGEFNSNLLRFVLVYILLGSGILATLWYQNRQQKTTPIGTAKS